MIRRRKKPEGKVTIPVAPMIDCVFLLLIYFMVSASLHPQEADLSFELPGTVEQETSLAMPDEQIIEITREGQVIVNDYAYDSPTSPQFVELAHMLGRLQATASANQEQTVVTLIPADETSHQTIVKVMDAIAIAGISGVHFALGGEPAEF